MFTGLIERTGKIVAKTSNSISIDTGEFAVAVGDSVSINGTCLTVSRSNKNIMSFDVSSESIKVTNLEKLGVNDVVNLERSMQANGRFHGHLVTGHVDTVGTISKVTKNSDSTEMIVDIKDVTLMRYLVAKGSVAINGVSLTVNELTGKSSFRLTLIPHTLKMTNLLDLKPGTIVNIEFDVLAKYVESMVKGGRHITEERLEELGYK